MEEIRNAISRCQLNLKLDDYTIGDGNCFPRAVVQQCRRLEIQINLNENGQTNTKDYFTLRAAVCNFMTNSQHHIIQQFKQSYIDNELPTIGIAWNDYWVAMSQDKVWVDYKFIQGTAWYLNQDVMIVTTRSTPINPYIFISGDMTNNNIPCPGIPLLIGSQLDQHYQSLLPGLINNFEVTEDQFPSLKSSSKPANAKKMKIVEKRNNEKKDIHREQAPEEKRKMYEKKNIKVNRENFCQNCQVRYENLKDHYQTSLICKQTSLQGIQGIIEITNEKKDNENAKIKIKSNSRKIQCKGCLKEFININTHGSKSFPCQNHYGLDVMVKENVAQLSDDELEQS